MIRACLPKVMGLLQRDVMNGSVPGGKIHDTHDLGVFRKRFAPGSGLLQPVEVSLPHFGLLEAHSAQVFPRVQAGVVAVAELQLEGIVAHRCDVVDGHMLFFHLQDFLAGAMTLDLGGWGVHPQKLCRQGVDAAIRIGEFQYGGLAVQPDVGGDHEDTLSPGK